MRCTRFKTNMDLYIRSDNDKELKAELRREILLLGKEKTIRNNDLKAKIAYSTIRFCPWLLKGIFPIYQSIKLFVLRIKNHRERQEAQ